MPTNPLDMPAQLGIRDIPAADYHADRSSLSSTGARTIVNDCPAVFRWQQDNPVNKRAFDIGTATHLLVLEPEKFAERVVLVRGFTKKGVYSPGYQTEDAIEQRDAAYAAGKTPLLEDEFELVRNMRAAIQADPLGSQAFIGGQAEKSLFWQDPEFGIICRTRPDYLPPHSRYIVDLKTAAACDPDSFGKSAATMGYHMQAAWYLDGIEAITGTRPEKFAFVVVGKSPPHLVTTHWVPPEALEWGATLNRYARGVFAWCTEHGEWPGYRDAVDQPAKAFDLRLPTWYRREIEERIAAGLYEPPHIERKEAA